MRSKIVIVIMSIVLILASTGYALEGDVVALDTYTRIGNLENRLGTVDVKVDRNSDIMKLGFDRNISDHNRIIGMMEGFNSRVNSLDAKVNQISSDIMEINTKLSSNLIDYTAAANKIDSNNKDNEVRLRGDTITTPAKTNYLVYILIGVCGGCTGAIIVLIAERISRPKHNVT